jgi:YegS C-terminal NAD kinase beta sandwich-like domain
VKPGDPWGEPVSGRADLEVRGGDADLARVLDTHQGVLVRFRAEPGSDLARTVGISASGDLSGLAAPIDGLLVEPGGHAVNGVVLGTAPGRLRATTPSATVTVRVNGRSVAAGRATTVVIANGQFFDGLDVVPRGHPGDGRLEVQVYALRRGERRAMRARLPQGIHLPHPRITTTTGRQVEIHVERGRLPMTIDGRAHEPVADLTVTLLPAALRLLL